MMTTATARCQSKFSNGRENMGTNTGRSAEPVIFREKGPVSSIILNRPDSMNSLTPEMVGLIKKYVRHSSRKTSMTLSIPRMMQKGSPWYRRSVSFQGGDCPQGGIHRTPRYRKAHDPEYLFTIIPDRSLQRLSGRYARRSSNQPARELVLRLS